MPEERRKAQFQPWDQIKFRSDPYLRRLSHKQVRMYGWLLHEAFICSHRPNLPNDDDLLWKLAECRSKTEWLENSGPIRQMFGVVEVDGESVLQHPRLVRDFERLTTGTVYFIQGVLTKRIKIGFTDKPVEARKGNLQVGSPDKLIILGTLHGNREVESYLQGRFASSKVHGEWFEQTDELLAFIKENKLCPSD